MLLAFALFLGFQTSVAQQATPQPDHSCTIEGTILAADTGQPLRKAWVSMRKAEGRGETPGDLTDASGHFVIRNVAPGRYYLSASRNGYVRQEYGQRSKGRWNVGTILTLSSGQHVRDISMRLIRAAAISGHIYDEDGDPLEGAQVSALQYGYSKGHRQLMPLGDASTNDLGAYRLYGLAPGDYIIQVSSVHGRFQFGSMMAGGPGYAPSYYPGTADPGQATPITVRGGDDFPGVDFSLQAVHAVTVSGKVFNAVTGQPAVGVSIFLLPRKKDQPRIFVFTSQTYVQDPQGSFKLEGVIPGSYYLLGFGQSDGKQLASRIPLEVSDAELTGINLVLTAGIDLKGRIEASGKLNPVGIRIFLSRPDENFYFGASVGTPKSDGSFAITHVPDGSYKVDVSQLPEDAYVKDIRIGGQSVLLSGFEVTGGQYPGNLEIVVSPNGGQLAGTVVKDNKTFSGATVVLVPDDAKLRKDGSFYKQTTTDQNGNFSLHGIRPGDYEAYAWEKIEQGAYQNPSFMEHYKDQGKAVEVKEGGQAVVQLSLASSDQSR